MSTEFDAIMINTALYDMGQSSLTRLRQLEVDPSILTVLENFLDHHQHTDDAAELIRAGASLQQEVDLIIGNSPRSIIANTLIAICDEGSPVTEDNRLAHTFTLLLGLEHDFKPAKILGQIAQPQGNDLIGGTPAEQLKKLESTTYDYQFSVDILCSIEDVGALSQANAERLDHCRLHTRALGKTREVARIIEILQLNNDIVALPGVAIEVADLILDFYHDRIDVVLGELEEILSHPGV